MSRFALHQDRGSSMEIADSSGIAVLAACQRLRPLRDVSSSSNRDKSWTSMTERRKDTHK
jgi:hypothetical protein